MQVCFSPQSSHIVLFNWFTCASLRLLYLTSASNPEKNPWTRLWYEVGLYLYLSNYCSTSDSGVMCGIYTLLLHDCLQAVMEELMLFLLMNHMRYSHVNVQSRYFPLILHMISSSIFTSEQRGLDTNREVRAERRSHHRGPIPTHHETHENLSLYLHYMEVFLFIYIHFPKKRKFSFQWTSLLSSCRVRRNCVCVKLLCSQIQHLFNLWAACSQPNQTSNDGFKYAECILILKETVWVSITRRSRCPGYRKIILKCKSNKNRTEMNSYR